MQLTILGIAFVWLAHFIYCSTPSIWYKFIWLQSIKQKYTCANVEQKLPNTFFSGWNSTKNQRTKIKIRKLSMCKKKSDIHTNFSAWLLQKKNTIKKYGQSFNQLRVRCSCEIMLRIESSWCEPHPSWSIKLK